MHHSAPTHSSPPRKAGVHVAVASAHHVLPGPGQQREKSATAERWAPAFAGKTTLNFTNRPATPISSQALRRTADNQRLWERTREVTRLGPDPAPLLPCLGSQRRTRRQPQPGIPGELLLTLREASVEDQQLDPAGQRRLDRDACRPVFHADALPGVLEKWRLHNTREPGRGH